MTAVTADCVLDAKAGIGEGALWCADQQVLWWVEILERKLHRFDPATGRDEVFETPSFIGCAALRKGGGLMVALQEGFAAFDPATGTFEVIPGCAPGETDRRFNDGAVSPEGRFLASTMMAAPPFDEPDQDLFVLDPDHKVRRLEGGLRIGNGLAFSNDGKKVYLSDSHPSQNRIWAYDWRGDEGVAENRRVFYAGGETPGHPDGAAVDVDGGYWFAAAYGWAVVRLTPTGRVDRIIPVPVQKPTKVTFGGPRLDTLFVTSIGTNLEPGSQDRQPNAGGLFALSPGVQGRAPHVYAG